MKLGAVHHLQQSDPSRAAALLAEAGSDIDLVLKELCDLAHDLVPALLLEGGLAPALAELAHRSGHEVHTAIESVGRFDSAIEQAVYCCCAEALQNAAKHAGSGARFELTLEREVGVLRLIAQDDGPGFMVSFAGKDRYIRRCGSEVGRRLAIGKRSGSGALVEGALPLAGASARACPPECSVQQVRRTPESLTGGRMMRTTTLIGRLLSMSEQRSCALRSAA